MQNSSKLSHFKIERTDLRFNYIIKIEQLTSTYSAQSSILPTKEQTSSTVQWPMLSSEGQFLSEQGVGGLWDPGEGVGRGFGGVGDRVVWPLVSSFFSSSCGRPNKVLTSKDLEGSVRGLLVVIVADKSRGDVGASAGRFIAPRR